MDDVERAFRAAYGPAVATLVRVFGDIALAEDAVQDAFLAATRTWPGEGIPANPVGWIVTSARNRAVDVVRREAKGRELYQAMATIEARSQAASIDPEEPAALRDDQLRLLFTCCHPALKVDHQVALTLRLIGGLSPAEIARAFLVTESTMAKRLTRARFKIKAANIPYRVPRDSDIPERLRSVLSVVYLIYTTGAEDRAGRSLLRAESIRLGRLLVELMPDAAEATGLLALMLLHEARIPAQGSTEVVLLRNQDRSLWNGALIAEGLGLVSNPTRVHEAGPFQLQALIQGVHCLARTVEETDWRTIVRLYDLLMVVMPTPVVALNRAIAVAETEGPEVALDLLAAVAEELDDYYLFHATRGTLLERLGDAGAAANAYGWAAERAPVAAQRRFLQRRLEELSGHQDPPASHGRSLTTSRSRRRAGPGVPPSL
jgi:RNA polymerase sigma-70 factor, ECF subfamily